jgi:hypothetical protein
MAKKITDDHIPSLPGEATRLTVRQLNAIDLLAQGQSDRDVGEAVGVARETVTRWRNGNAAFQAELNRLRAHLWQRSHDQIRSLVQEAIDTLADAMRAGDVRAAVAIIKTAGLPEAIAEPTGEQDAAAILWREAMRRAEMERALELEENPPVDDIALAMLPTFAEEAETLRGLRRRARQILEDLVAEQLADADE